MLTPDHFDSQSAELLRSGRPVLAGISGGRDSMALLSLLSGMPGCNLVACHVNHQLRPEAEEEEMFVLRYAASLGYSLCPGTRQCPQYGPYPRNSH